MDPLSITASIFACLTGTEFLLAQSKKLYDAAREFKSASKNIRSFAKQVETFSGSVNAACLSIRSYTPQEYAEYPPVLRYLADEKIVVKARRQFTKLRRELDTQLRKIQAYDNEYGVIIRAKWVWQQKKVTLARLKMESVKITFSLLMHSVLLEEFRTWPRTDQVQHLIDQKRNEMRDLFNQIRSLQLQQEAQASVLQIGTTSRATVFDIGQQVQKALMVLGHSQVIDKRVPGYPRSESPMAPPEALEIVSPSPSPRVRSRTEPLSANESSVTPRSARPLRVETTLPESSDRQIQGRSGSPKSNTSSEIQGGASHPNDQSEFIAVHGEDNIIHLNENDYHQIEHGSIQTINGKVTVKARVMSQINLNLITQQFATQNNINVDLFVDETDLDEASKIQVGQGLVERCIGTAVLYWQLPRWHGEEAFPVHCSVCVHSITGVVLGSGFIEKKHYYRTRRG